MDLGFFNFIATNQIVSGLIGTIVGGGLLIWVYKTAINLILNTNTLESATKWIDQEFERQKTSKDKEAWLLLEKKLKEFCVLLLVRLYDGDKESIKKLF